MCSNNGKGSRAIRRDMPYRPTRRMISTTVWQGLKRSDATGTGFELPMALSYSNATEVSLTRSRGGSKCWQLTVSWPRSSSQPSWDCCWDQNSDVSYNPSAKTEIRSL